MKRSWLLLAFFSLFAIAACQGAPETENPETAADAVSDSSKGVFTVDSKGTVSVDYLYDGSKLTGELAVFTLAGMDSLAPGSDPYIIEALKRAYSAGRQGEVVIADAKAGARYTDAKLISPDLTNDNANVGAYVAPRPVKFTPGTKVAFLFVPNNTVQNVLKKFKPKDTSTPIIFSQYEANAARGSTKNLVVSVDNSRILGIEESTSALVSERDYNDVVFRLEGVTGIVDSLCQAKGTCASSCPETSTGPGGAGSSSSSTAGAGGASSTTSSGTTGSTTSNGTTGSTTSSGTTGSGTTGGGDEPKPPPAQTFFTAKLADLTALNASCTTSSIQQALGYPATCVSAAVMYCSKQGFEGAHIVDAALPNVEISCFKGVPMVLDFGVLGSFDAGCTEAKALSDASPAAEFSTACIHAAANHCVAKGYAGGAVEEFDPAKRVLGLTCATSASTVSTFTSRLMDRNAACTEDLVLASAQYPKACVLAASKTCSGSGYGSGFITTIDKATKGVKILCEKTN